MKPKSHSNLSSTATSHALYTSLVLFASALAADAATFTWDGGGADNKASTGANWVGDAVPLPAGYDIVFSGTSAVGTSVNWDYAQNFRSLTFDSAALAYTIGGATAIQFVTAGIDSIVNNSANTQTITDTVNLFFNGSKGFNTGSLAGGVLSLTNVAFRGDSMSVGQTNTLTLTGSNNGTIGGTITTVSMPAGTNATITKTGTGTWTLSGSNNYAGNTTISGGILKIGNANALGFGGRQTTANGTTTVSSGFTLDLNGTTGVSEVITLSGTGIGGNGALVNNSINPAGISSGIAGLTVAATGLSATVYSSVPVVVISGTGTGATATASLGLTQASINSITSGGTGWLTGDTVNITGGGGSGAVATVTASAGVITNLTLTSAGAGYSTAPTTLTKLASAGGAGTTTISGNATNFTVGGLTVTAAGSGYTGTPTFTFAGVVQTPTVALSSVILAANSSIGGTGDMTIAPAVSGGFSLTKVGVGAVTLSGANTYTGTTDVQNGTLTLSGNRTVTTGTMTVAGGGSGTTPILNIQNGNFGVSGSFIVGSGGSNSTVNHSAGTISSVGGSGLLMGSGGTASSANYNLSGGALTVSSVIMGVNNITVGTGVNIFTQTGGTFTPGTLRIGRYDVAGSAGTNNTFAQSAGTATITNLGLGGNTADSAGTNPISANLTLTGGFFTATNFASLSAGGANTSIITIGGTADVTLPEFPTVRGVGSTATITFDGGTLKPAAASTTYMGGLTNAYITSNGAKIDVATGNDITVSQALQNASGNVGTLTKLGVGVLSLSGANTYTGLTTITAGTLQISGTSGTLGSGSVTNNGTLVFNRSNAMTVTNAISGTGTIYQKGAGTTTLDPGAVSNSIRAISADGGNLILKSGTFATTGVDPSFTAYNVGAGARGGTLTIDGATLNVGAGKALKVGAAANGDLDIKSGTVTASDLVLGHNGSSTGTQSGGNVTVTNIYHKDGGNGSSYTLSGGTLTAQRIFNDTASTYDFTLNLNGGTLKSATGTTNLIDTQNTGTQITVLLGTGNTIIDTTASSASIIRPLGDMSGQAGAFTKAGSNTLTLTGSNSYTGTTTITAGTLQLDGSTDAASTVHIGTSGTLTGTGTVNGNATLTGGGTVNKSSGTIAGTLGVTGGNWNGNGSVTGAVTSSSGIFTIGSGANLTASGGLNVTGGTLTGTGTITGATTIENTATHNAGGINSVGSQAFAGNLNYGAGSIFEWDLNANSTATGFDTVSATGDIDVSSTDTVFKVVFGTGVNLADSFWSTAHPTQTWSMTAIFGQAFNSGAFTSVTSTADPVTQGQFTISGSSLTWTAVPEPTSALAGLLLGAGLLRRRRL